VSGYEGFGSSLQDLPRLRSSRRRRASSCHRSGGNGDRLTIEPGATATLAEINGAGSINHIWITVGHANKRSDDLSSVAYWYQAEPHRPFSIEPVERRVPRSG
jgi:hypothetical protein